MRPERAPLSQRLGWALILLSLPVLTLIRIHPVDIPWHLATARLAEELGRWPARNTFSYTFPDYPLYQQYPVFQTIAWGVFKLGAWEGLSLLLLVWWAAVLALFLRWGGPLRAAAALHAPWMFVLLSLQTRIALRPDLLSLTLLAAELLVIDAYRERDRRALLALPLLHWLWANGHQLFVLSFAVQGLFLGHLLLARLGRLGVDRRDAALPIWPPLAALAASAGASFLTPLGAEVLGVYAHTTGSLAQHRGHVQELARVWSDPAWLVIGLGPGLAAAVALARTRRCWSPFDAGVWLLGLALAWNAIRGLVYFTLVSGAVLERSLQRRPIEWQPSRVLRRFGRAMALAMTAAVAVALVYHRHVAPGTEPGATEAGLGRTHGDWPDDALSAVQADPPPGRMMNVPWALANATLWAWPERGVFVDPRFEAYPRPFLNQVIASYDDDRVLDGLVDRWQPGWIFGAHCAPNLRARLTRLARDPRWALTYADVQALVLVRRAPEAAGYIARHPFTPHAEPRGLLPEPARRVHQRRCWADLLEALGHADAARAQRARAAAGS